jgi:hypothetical protein
MEEFMLNAMLVSGRGQNWPALPIIRKLARTIAEYDHLLRNSLHAHQAYERLRHQCDVELGRQGLTRHKIPQAVRDELFMR